VRARSREKKQGETGAQGGASERDRERVHEEEAGEDAGTGSARCRWLDRRVPSEEREGVCGVKRV
jgi:hypothetical protein